MLEPKKGFSPGGDFGAGVIRGVVVAQVGVAKGRKLFADETFLEQLRDAIQETGDNGTKARLGHSLRTEATGTYLGRFKNPKIGNDGKLRADLHLSEAASKSPHGDLADYVATVVGESPTSLGASAFFVRDVPAEREFKRNNRGSRSRSSDPRNPAGFTPMRVASLSSIDLVDRAALNDGLFLQDATMSREGVCDSVAMLCEHMPVTDAIQAVREGKTAVKNGQAVRPLVKFK